jgi:hypothetical protein
VIAVRFLAIAGLLSSGCFYLDPIVERPRIGLRVVEPEVGAPFRGGTMTITTRPTREGQLEGTFAWRAFACASLDTATCSDAAFETSDRAIWELRIPGFVDNSEVPVQAILVTLDARDVRGVLALAEELYPIANQSPALELRKVAHSFTVGAPIDVFAKYGDPDDGPAGVTLEWSVFTPNTQPAYTFDDLVLLKDPVGSDRTEGRQLIAQGSGEWEVAVVARDRLGETLERRMAITVAADRPPCLAQSQPLAPPDGASLPVTEPTVFQVQRVDDDLDAHPQVVGHPAFGSPAFTWSILRPDAADRELLSGATGNSIDFDPSAFTPGDIVELRVEIFDRNRTALPCPDSVPTCSVISQPACLQRQTWRVEVR